MNINIGIDPDIDKSGFAIWNKDSHEFESISCENFFDALELIKLYSSEELTVFIEAAWLLNKSSWHGAKNLNIAARIGKNVGSNHQVGRLFAEYCKRHRISCVLAWPRGKQNAKCFKQITGWKGRTNSEQRDAAMLVFGR